jgi:hypothetical protein
MRATMWTGLGSRWGSVWGLGAHAGGPRGYKEILQQLNSFKEVNEWEINEELRD